MNDNDKIQMHDLDDKITEAWEWAQVAAKSEGDVDCHRLAANQALLADAVMRLMAAVDDMGGLAQRVVDDNNDRMLREIQRAAGY